MSDKHMEDVMRELDEKTKNWGSASDGDTWGEYEKGVKDITKQVCRSYARKVVREIEERCNQGRALVGDVCSQIDKRLTDKEPT